MRLIPAALAAVALLLGGVPADGARYTKSEVQVSVKKTKLTAAPKKSAEAERKRPALDVEQFRATTKAKVASLTDEAIRKLKQLLQITSDTDAEKPDFLFRLAEHFREKKIGYEFRARELDEKIFKASDSAAKSRMKSSQKAYEKQSRDWMVQAIRMYLEIYSKPVYRKFNRMDEVLFNLAAMLNEVGRRDKAREVFSRLIKDYPESRYIADAFLSFAEYYFNQGQVENALRLYERVGKYPNSPIYGYAVYKQGWCWLNLQDPRRALELFVRVINNANKWAGTKKAKIVLVKEAQKDAVRAYSHVGTPGRAWDFFKRIGGNYAMKMLERLATLYYDQGKFLDSIQIYKELIKLNPKSKQLCDWQYAIVRSTLSGKDKRQQVVETKRLAAVHKLISRTPGVRKSALNECRSNASGLLRELATTWHREAQKTQNEDTYALAQYLYKEYLDHFPREKDAYVMSFYYAELLFKLERWEPAAEAYTKVVKMQPRGKHLNEAAYAAVIAWRNALNVEQEIKDVQRRDEKDKELKEKPIPEKEQRMIAAFDTYIKYVPQSEELVPIKYRKARIYYEANHFAKAAEMFGDIATKHTDHELAIYSANLLLDALNAMKAFDDLEKWIDRFLGTPQLAQGEFLAMLNKLKSGIQAKQAEAYREAKRFRECGERYAHIANAYPEHDQWSTWVFNAAICFEATKLIGLAISLRSTLIKVKPEDPLAQKALYMIGANYHALAWYSRAAEHYEQFAQKFPGEKEAPAALQNAIVFRLGRAEYDKAIDNAKLFAKQYGNRPKYASRTAAVMFSLGQIWEQRNDPAGMTKHYTSYLNSWGGKGGADRRILANVRIGEALWRESCPTKGINGACIKLERVRSKMNIRKASPRKGKGKKKRREIELKKQCGPETKSKITVVSRNRARAAKAIQHFRTALKLSRGAARGIKGEGKEEIARRKQDMLFAVAAARFHEAEQLFERFLDVEFPKGLDFSGGQSKAQQKKLAESQKTFAKYLADKGRLLNQTSEVYQDVIKMQIAHWAIAAAARIGQLYQNFADALFTAPVPKPPVPAMLRTQEQREEFIDLFTDKYCETLEEKAAPLEEKAVEGLATCLQKSTELSWYNEWSQLCEAELNQIKPAEYPMATEIRAEPQSVSVRANRAGIIDRLK